MAWGKKAVGEGAGGAGPRLVAYLLLTAGGWWMCTCCSPLTTSTTGPSSRPPLGVAWPCRGDSSSSP